MTYLHDTAVSSSRIKSDGSSDQAAIASEEAARMQGLHVLKRDIANQSENYTRFLVIAKKERPVDPKIPCRTSLVMATGQKPGALVEALLVFREHGLAMSKLESRPIPGNPWEEMFYVDFEGNTADPDVDAALDDLRRVTRFLKVLGCYPAHDLPRTELSPQVVAGAVDQPAAASASVAAPPEAPKAAKGKKPKATSS